MKKNCPTLQYLVIDLTKEKWSVHTIPQSVFASYLGGDGVGLYLYEAFCPSGERNCELEPIVFTTGICTQFQIFESDSLTITARSSSSHMVRSVQGRSSFASSLISCGFSALVLTGSARRQMVIELSSEHIGFTASEKLINKKVSETLTLLNLSPLYASIVIGPAGENKIPFASLISDGRSIEREGFGALLGAKRIKALVIEKGPYTFISTHQKEIQELTDQLEKRIKKSLYYKKEQKENHLAVVRSAHEGGFASVAHLTKRCDPRMAHLFGSEYPHLYSPTTIDAVIIKDLQGNDVVMDSNAMLAFGSNIKNFDPVVSATYTYLSIDLGLDPISTAMVISWVMEGVERGIVDDILLKYDDFSHIEEIIESIAQGTGYGKKLAKGSASLAKEYNNVEFISSINGKEMLPYDIRGAYGQGLLMALGYDFHHPFEVLHQIMPLTDSNKKAASVIIAQHIYIISSALGINYHTLTAFLNVNQLSPLFYEKCFNEVMTLLSKIIGYLQESEYSGAELVTISRRTLLKEELINAASRASLAHVPLQFLLNVDSNFEKESTIPLTKLLDEYKVLHEIDLTLCKEEVME